MACMLCARCRQQNKVPLAKKMTLLAEGSLHSTSHKNTAVRRNQTLPHACRASARRQAQLPQRSSATLPRSNRRDDRAMMTKKERGDMNLCS